MKFHSRFASPAQEISKYVRVPADDVFLLADLHIPEFAVGLVILAYSFGGSRNHPRTREVSGIIREVGLGTLLCDLLTEEEVAEDEVTQRYRNDAEFLARRLIAVTKWATKNPEVKKLPVSYFGACTGGAAAMIAAAKLGKKVKALVSRGGRLEQAMQAIPHVKCPTLLIVGDLDKPSLALSREAMDHLQCEKELVVIPGASHLFGEPGKLEEMARHSAVWLRRHSDKTQA
jgi:putative phosphoribosyl transferase